MTNIDEVERRLKEVNKTDMEIETILNKIKYTESNKVYTPSNRKKISEVLKRNNISRDDFRSYHFTNDRMTAVVIRKEKEVIVTFSFCHRDDYYATEKNTELRRTGILMALKNFEDNKYTFHFDRLPSIVDSVFYAICAYKKNSDSFPTDFKNLRLWIDFDYHHYN